MRKSTIDTLPPEIREWLAQTLIRRGFAGYDRLVGELDAKGFKRSRSALGRWGFRLEHEVARERNRRLASPA